MASMDKAVSDIIKDTMTTNSVKEGPGFSEFIEYSLTVILYRFTLVQIGKLYLVIILWKKVRFWMLYKPIKRIFIITKI